MTQLDKALIERECRLIKDFPIEHAVVIRNGKTINHLVGDSYGIDIPDRIKKYMKNSHFIHNHPTNDLSFEYCSCPYLSEVDINTSINLKIKSITSISTEGWICTFFPNENIKIMENWSVNDVLDVACKKYDNDFEKSYKFLANFQKKQLIKFIKKTKHELYIWRLK
jgi:hypothetical protein